MAKRKPTGLFGRLPRPPSRKRRTAKELVDDGRRIAFEITNAVTKGSEWDTRYRDVVHNAHVFVNRVKENKADAGMAIDLLQSSRALIGEIRSQKRDEKDGQGRLF